MSEEYYHMGNTQAIQESCNAVPEPAPADFDREHEELSATINPGDPAHVLPNSLTYVVGAGKLFVFDDGQLLTAGEDYTETSTTSITFLRRTTAGSNMTYVVFS